jgi:hypothetical protein
MSFKARSRNRACAKYVLDRLYKVSSLPFFWIKEEHWYHKVPSLTVEELESTTDKYSKIELNRAMGLLLTEKFISVIHVGHPATKKGDIETPTIILTIEGQAALLDNYYGTLIRRDLLETVELTTKWILPILAVIISLMAYFKK